MIANFILALSFLLISVPAMAATYWVQASGNDGNQHCVNSASPPASTNTSRTITQGIGCLSSGDTLYIRTGTYSQTITTAPSGTPSARTLISAYNNEVVTVNGSGTNMFILNGAFQYITFYGLILDSINASAEVYINGASNLIFDHIEFKNSAENGLHITPGTNNIQILNGSIHDNGYRSPGANDCGGSHGAYIGGDHNTFQNNEIYTNHGYGLHFYDGGNPNAHDNLITQNRFHGLTQACAGVLVRDGANNRVINNLFYSNAGDGIQVANGCTNCEVYGNTVTGNGVFGMQSNSATVTVKNNIFWNNGNQSIFNGGGGTITQSFNLCDAGCTGTGAINAQNPLFVNAAGANYALQSGSPARNTGTALTASIPYNVDIANTPRPQGAQWDIGAYEFAAASLPVLAIKAISPSAPSTCDAAFSVCTVVGSANNIITLSGTSTQSGGSVAWTCDRCGSGGFTGTVASWITTNITLKSGVNIITITGTDGTGNSGSTQITVTFVPTFPGNTAVLLLGLENGSGTTATDSSGNNNTGALVNGPTWVTTGRFGKALSFNGINQYITISDANSLHLTQGFTISAWVQPTSSFTTFKAIMHENSDPLASPYQLYASVNGYCGSGGISGFTNVNGASGPQYSACTPTPLQTNVWTHLALTYDQTNLKLYRNGALVVTTPASGYLEPSSLTLQIGGSEFGEQFQGLLDEVRLYNFALPLSAGSNTVPGAACTAANWLSNTDVNTASIIGNMNCPIINLSPPSQFKISAGATQMKFLSSSTAAKIGANP